MTKPTFSRRQVHRRAAVVVAARDVRASGEQLLARAQVAARRRLDQLDLYCTPVLLMKNNPRVPGMNYPVLLSSCVIRMPEPADCFRNH